MFVSVYLVLAFLLIVFVFPPHYVLLFIVLCFFSFSLFVLKVRMSTFIY